MNSIRSPRMHQGQQCEPVDTPNCLCSAPTYSTYLMGPLPDGVCLGDNSTVSMEDENGRAENPKKSVGAKIFRANATRGAAERKHNGSNQARK